MLFGGGSIRRRELKISGTLKTQSGNATVQIKTGNDTTQLTTNKDGTFETTVSLTTGGSYVVVVYDHFVGEVEISAEYVK
ncbi:hypothetical protein SDC9_180071 [bioreactor metagenome]|uniref:Bacterial Ig domain-containing protein n=1 Tax=bioreactor metagenome TaxID=1076179 RepID=A0A645H0K5_9ZZZZ